ncbi:hypothetical protein PHYPSEUDO_007567 [Phytophthora pseudosyringae]|uniref:Uncharacterized protein n=1 Tax=Phytophthora pseudosyringae TaxID=221518 RepID=A0A8T1VGU4_9STRA|nr:hypothetical protein PHYPSEUDO_007567 [Phytophthora pseudosyringae]
MQMKRKQKPASAYQYYQKLAKDFDTLEREMESHHAEQSELEAQLERAQAKIQASKAEDQQAQQLQWERERDRQLETFVQQRTALETLRAQTEALEDQELCLQAEMEVLHERQQEVSDTEARQIRRLVHERTTLLEDELAKGKLDLDYITQVVSTARRQELKQKVQCEEGHTNALLSVKNVVQDVQERRRRDFEVAEENFQARMRSFQLEKDALAKKAKALQVTKKRALQILSQNQQLAIKGFFDTSPTAQQREEKITSAPSLDFGEILQSLNQSGAQVEQIQAVDSERNSGRPDFADALRDARATLENGTQRVEAIQRNLEDRKADARKLGITIPGTTPTGYDGAWGIESYSPRQYETVYLMRGLVFSWMDAAVAEVRAQPAKELLELEVKRWRSTHSSVEHDRDRERNLSLAGQILANFVREAITEIAGDIRSEFESTSRRVRGTVLTAITNALFPTLSNKFVSSQVKKTPAKTQGSAAVSTSTLHSSLFALSLDHMRTLRNRPGDSKSTTLLHQCCLPVSERQAGTTTNSSPPATKSPVKKVFGLFSVSRGGKASAAKRDTPPQPQDFIPSPSKPGELEAIPLLSPDVPITPPSAGKLAMTFWQNEPQLRLRTITAPSSQGYCSCLQLSPNGDQLICGTTEGELVLWDLLPDPPALLRVWSPPKAERSRITRVILSPDSQLVIAFFRRKTIGVFAINPSHVQATTASQGKLKPAMHSEDCFPADSTKYRPRSLEMLMQISAADALAELSFTSELRERAPNAVAKDPATGWAGAELSCGFFFPSYSLIGMVTWNPSIMCGASTGDLLKFNLQPKHEGSKGTLNAIQAAFDSPGPTDNQALDTKTIRREFFRGHRRAVLFASCVHRESSESKPTELLSMDQDGIVCVWEYDADKFTGFGWFEPSLRLCLELTCVSSDLVSQSLAGPTPSAPKRLPSRRLPLPPESLSFDYLEGEILQVALTPDDARLIVMVFYADPTKKVVAGTLRFLQILTSPMRLDRVQMNVDFAGGHGAPRFALTTNFLLLLANNLVRVYILRAGKEAREPISLSPPGQQQLVFNNITCSTSPKPSFQTKLGSPTKTTRRQTADPTTITFVASGDQHSRLLVHSFTTFTPHSPEKKANTKRVR